MNLKVFHNKILSNSNPGLLAGVFLFVLKLLSYIYYSIIKIRNFCYQKEIFKSYKISLPVIVVGNITAGGTGKTPFCLELIKLCENNSIKVGVISRGYGGDESQIYKIKYPQLPQIINSDRVKGCRELVETYPKVQAIIADDGYQHLRLKRDIDIVLINANNPFGFQYCLPRGYLREPLEGLNRAKVIIITHTNEIQIDELNDLKRKLLTYISPNTPILLSDHEPDRIINPDGIDLTIDSFKSLSLNKPAVLSGIANPSSFIKTLNSIGISPVQSFIFDDHHQYTKENFEYFTKNKLGFDYMITTEKDIVKIPSNLRKELNIFTLKIKLKISDSQILLEMIKKLV